MGSDFLGGRSNRGRCAPDSALRVPSRLTARRCPPGHVAATLFGSLVAVFLGGCGIGIPSAPTPRLTDVPSATLAPDPTPVPRTPEPTPIPSQPGPTPTPIYTFTIRSAEYGYVELAAPPGSSCFTIVSLPEGEVVGLAAQTVGASGRIYWKYPQSPRPGGTGRVSAQCTLMGKSDIESLDFEVKA